MVNSTRIPREYRMVLVTAPHGIGKTTVARFITSPERWDGNLPLIVDDPEVLHPERREDSHKFIERLLRVAPEGRVVMTHSTRGSSRHALGDIVDAFDLVISYSTFMERWVIEKDRRSGFPQMVLPGCDYPLRPRGEAREAR